MSNETTPAIERAAAALNEYVGTHTQDMEAEGVPEMAVRQAEVREALSAAFDVEEVARALHDQSEFADTWEQESQACRNGYLSDARAVRDALLGTTS